jgi:3-oxoacyl-[acyl-carrier-protein] synthase-3
MQRKTQIIGTGSYFPGPAVGNDVLEQVLDYPVASMMSYFGIESRHFAVDPKTGERREAGLGTTEMGARAAEKALKAANVTPDSIDLIITNTTTNEQSLPLLYSQLQRRLGLGEVVGIDMRGGCSASIQSLIHASMMIESGHVERALVVSTECISPYCYAPLLGRTGVSSKEIINGLIFGDGAGAVVLQRSDSSEAQAKTGMHFGCFGVRSIFPEESFGFELSGAGSGKLVTKHNNKIIADVVPRIISRVFDELFRMESRDKYESDVLIVPQVNSTMIDLIDPVLLESLSKRSMFYCGDEIGSVPTAGVPIALDKALRSGFIDNDSRVQIVAVDTASWSYAFVELLP